MTFSGLSKEKQTILVGGKPGILFSELLDELLVITLVAVKTSM